MTVQPEFDIPPSASFVALFTVELLCTRRNVYRPLF